jgi:hypothetical protein
LSTNELKESDMTRNDFSADLAAFNELIAGYAMERAVELNDQRKASTDPAEIAFIDAQIATASGLYNLTLNYREEAEARAGLEYLRSLTPEGRAALVAGGPVEVK